MNEKPLLICTVLSLPILFYVLWPCDDLSVVCVTLELNLETLVKQESQKDRSLFFSRINILGNLLKLHGPWKGETGKFCEQTTSPFVLWELRSCLPALNKVDPLFNYCYGYSSFRVVSAIKASRKLLKRIMEKQRIWKRSVAVLTKHKKPSLDVEAMTISRNTALSFHSFPPEMFSG